MSLDFNIQAVIDNFPFVCSCVSAYKDAPADLEAKFGLMLTALK
jgi:hypothetical protein